MSADLGSWTPRPSPGLDPLEGDTVRVEPVTDERHFEALWESFAQAEDGLWRYLGYGPFADRGAFLAMARRVYLGPDIRFHVVVPKASGRAEGVAALMRTDAANGVTEIGHICLGPGLAKSRAATEAFFLLMRRVFGELGYRRYEWKCDSENEPSRRAADRLGFRFEGVFRQHMVVKGRNRDTAWFSIIDTEWPALERAFEAWLAPDNFDAAGRQRRRLAELR
ncbi:GNAT family N-acetyltransferase [Mangrovibrevibacter kandeliae]|uniref:GNAT family N-acetyltransferase n=1 Tax=Mangrovibrevibacter kandeliae TaxID=2968473 RepID=UPI002117AC63|nr:GNAT family protein [Aurantimonas sp. CSK15Z-1]MCQ8782012.1 GNAT family N-acetyltransferase [Aurantimonas sp. CSK15Z-1]